MLMQIDDLHDASYRAGITGAGSDETSTIPLKAAGLQSLITTLPCNKFPFEYSLK